MSKNLYTFEVDMQFKVLSKVKAKEIKSLSSKKERDRKRLFLVEGEKGVRDILNSFKIKNLICTKEWLEAHEELKSKFEEEILVGDKGIIKTTDIM